MPRPPRIGVIVDHPDRDLITAAMLALALSRRGCVTSVIPLYEQGVDVPLIGLDAIVVNFLRPANRAVIERYRALGIAIYVLDTEGGVLAQDGPNSPDRMAATVRDEGWGTLAEGYFFWGPVLHAAFQRAGALAADRLHLTGCPRFDPVAPQWRAMLRYDKRDFILVNTAFPLVNSRFTADGYDRSAMIAAGWDPAYVEAMARDSAGALTRMIALVALLARRFPEREFLLRPHPFEREATYAAAFEGLANVTISGSGSVLNVIANAACVIQLNCSTAIEALMLDKLPLSPDFISTPLLREHSPLPNRASRLVEDEDELVAVLADLPAAHAAFDFEKRYANLAEPYFFHRDGKAGERVAAILADAPCRAEIGPLWGESLRSAHAHPRPAQRLQGLVANLVGSAALSHLRARVSGRRKGKRLSPAALAELVNAAAAAAQVPAPRIVRHRHPLTGLPLASIMVAPAGTPHP